jgi:hypothetical protein
MEVKEMKKVICALFGHKWIGTHEEVNERTRMTTGVNQTCDRCGRKRFKTDKHPRHVGGMW